MSINLFEHAGAIGIIIGIVWALIGNAGTRILMFPLFYLYFGLPEGDFLVPYLQDLTAKVVVTLLRASDIPVFLEGRYLTIPSGHFHVAKACSGINYLIATLAVGTVFAYLRFRHPFRRILFMSLAVFVPLAANGVRAYGIVMIAHLSNYKYAMGVDHFIYGWLFFGVVIFALFALGNLFSDVDDDKPPSYDGERPSSVDRRAVLGTTIFAFALLVGAKALAWAGTGIGNSTASVALPEATASRQLQRVADKQLGGEFFGATEYLAGRYVGPENPEDVVHVEAYYYRQQRQGAEVINFKNSVYDDERWRRISGPRSRVVPGGTPGKVFEMVLRQGAKDYLLWYWYDISGYTTLNPFQAKLLSKRAALFDDYRGEAAMVVWTPIIDSLEDDAAIRLQRFVVEENPGIARMTQ